METRTPLIDAAKVVTNVDPCILVKNVLPSHSVIVKAKKDTKIGVNEAKFGMVAFNGDTWYIIFVNQQESIFYPSFEALFNHYKQAFDFFEIP